MELLIAALVGYVLGAMMMRWKSNRDRRMLETIIGQQRQHIAILDKALEVDKKDKGNVLSPHYPKDVGEEFN